MRSREVSAALKETASNLLSWVKQFSRLREELGVTGSILSPELSLRTSQFKMTNLSFLFLFLF